MALKIEQIEVLLLVAALVAIAARYFRWTGPASLAHFQWFSGLGSKAVREAVSPMR